MGQDGAYMSQKTRRKRKALAERMKQPSLVKKILLINAHKAKRKMNMQKNIALLKLKQQNQRIDHYITRKNIISLKKDKNNIWKPKHKIVFGV